MDISDLIVQQNLLLTEIIVKSDWSVMTQTVTGGIVSAIVGAVFAYLLTRHHQTNIIKYEKINFAVNAFLNHLNSFEYAAVEYWERDYEINTDRKAESSIKHNLQRLRRYGGLLSKITKLNKKDSGILDNALNDIFDIATGSDFESKKRTGNRSIVRKISIKCQILTELAIDQNNFKTAIKSPTK